MNRNYTEDYAVPTYRLTANQLQLLAMLATGDSLKMIARQTGRAKGTLSGTRALMLRHLHCTTTIEMIVMAMRAGWIV